MARTRKIDEETGEITGVSAPESLAEEEKIYRFWEDPYLSEEQRELLINYEMKKLLETVKVNTYETIGAWTLLKYTRQGIQSEYEYYLVNAVGKDLKIAWEFYQQHVKSATIGGFLTKLREVLGADHVKYKEIVLLDMD